MNYYYDIFLNFNKEYISFYEWEETDDIEEIMKIPIIKISENLMNDILNYNFVVDDKLLNKIENKTLLKDIGLVNGIKYSCIFTDSINCIAIEFDDKGYSKFRSSLLLEDDLNILENSFNSKIFNFNINKKNKIIEIVENRKLKKIQNIIEKEITKTYKENNYAKLKFYYLNLFDEEENEFNNMYKKIMSSVRDNYNNKILSLYDMIELSSNNV